MIFRSLVANYQDLKSICEPFTDVILEFLHAAVVTEEIPEHPLPNVIAHLIFDYFLVVLSYWQNDETAHFSGTTKFIDLSLGMIAAFLKSGIVSGFMDFGIYFTAS